MLMEEPWSWFPEAGLRLSTIGSCVVPRWFGAFRPAFRVTYARSVFLALHVFVFEGRFVPRRRGGSAAIPQFRRTCVLALPGQARDTINKHVNLLLLEPRPASPILARLPPRILSCSFRGWRPLGTQRRLR